MRLPVYELDPTGASTAWVPTRQPDGTVVWAPPLPPGGVAGQTLTKQSSTDGDAAWETPSGGGGGGVPHSGDAKRRTSGDLTFSGTTAVVSVDTGLDMTITATAGDVILYGASFRAQSAASSMFFDVYTVPGGVETNPFGAGLDAAVATKGGWMGWVADQSADRFINGPARRKLVAGDISAGAVTLRLKAAKVNTTSRQILASSRFPIDVWCVNLGPTA